MVCALRFILSGVLAVAVFSTLNNVLHAQPPMQPTTPPAGAKGPIDPKAAPSVEPEPIDIEMKDGLLLKLNYYKSAKGRESAVILILHQEKGSRQQYDALAKELCKAGFAVVVPDLRGHGDSNSIQIKKIVGGLPKVAGTKKAVQTLGRQHLELMVKEDLEKVKTFMIERHNKGEFNIRGLCVLGVEMGAVVGVNWASLVDWNWPNLTTGPQGKDVRGLVLISPSLNYKGMNMKEAINQGEYMTQIPALILVGNKEDLPFKNAESINDQLARYHPKVAAKDKQETKGKSPEKEKDTEVQTLYLRQYDTSLQGYELITGVGRKLRPDPVVYIINFVDLNVAAKADKWAERKTPN